MPRKYSLKNMFKVKIKVNKKHLKRALWLLSVVLAGYLLFHFSYLVTRPQSTPEKPKVAVPLEQTSIVFVIDDIGAHDKFKKEMQRLGSDITYAILPLLPYSRYFGNLGKSMDAEVILHLPLDTTQDIIPGRGLIVSTMPEEQILDTLARDIDSVPYISGVNNHMGSRGTTDEDMMTIIMKELKSRNLFFLDSYTTKDSVAPKVAKKVGIPFLQRGVFLDNIDEKNAIRKEIDRLEKVARQKGSAIAIGHYRKNTLEVLAREIPRLKKKGFAIISLRRLLDARVD